MSASPRVSIVLPNYNYARYLDERIRTLLDQTFGDFELIIVDDASTDDSRAVIDAFASDTRVRMQFYKVNSGHPYQRWNDGAAMARGEYLLFAGADDRCESTLVESLVSRLDANPECGLAHARSWMIDAGGRPLRLRPTGTRWDHDFVAHGADEAPFMLVKNSIPNASALLLRRSLFQTCGGFDLSYRLSADHALWVRMLSHAGVAYVATPLNGWRTHSGTVRAESGAHRFVLERYRAMALVLEHFAIDANVRERAMQVAVGQWVRAVLEGSIRTNLRFDVAIGRAAKCVDPFIYRRLARELGKAVLRPTPKGAET